jgi:uncharacterized tellurite resistance protein B-like protein
LASEFAAALAVGLKLALYLAISGVPINPAITGSFMFESFRNFVAEFVEGERHPSQFADNDYRLAAVALLVHAAAIDGDVSPSERDKLRSVVKRRFDLDEAAADELIDKATAAEHEAVDLYHFTSLLNRTLDEAGRARVIEMMWEIVYADGRRDELEDNLLWRAADLLGVSSRERIELRRRIGGEAEAGSDE